MTWATIHADDFCASREHRHECTPMLVSPPLLVAEQAFLYVGGIEDVRKRAKEMA